MWTNKQIAPNSPTPSNFPESGRQTGTPAPADLLRQSSHSARTTAWLGPSLNLKGELSGSDDLHIESKLEGPVSLGGNRLTVGRSGSVKGQVVAREVIVHGKVQGDVRAHDRVEIKKDGSLVGDLTTARIVIEDGAYFKGNIEIDRESKPIGTDLEGLLARSTAKVE